VAVLVGAGCGLAYLIAGHGNGLMVAIGIAVAPAVLALVAFDVRNIRTADASSRLSVAAVASLPLLMVFVQAYPWATLPLQSLFALVVVLLFASAQAERRAEWLKITGPVRLLGALLGLTLALSYVASGVSGLGDAASLISLLLASAFFVMPVLIVDNLSRFEWLLAILLVVGASQVAVVAAQAAGLTNGLPAPFSALDAVAHWATSPYTADPIRYAGTFGDYEALAEYASLVTILGIGLCAVSRRRSLRVLGVLCSAGAVVTGLLTATRAYPVAVAIGLGVLMLLLLTHRSRDRAAPAAKVAAVAVLLTAGVFTLVPDAVRENMFGRFGALEVTGPNALNRGLMFDAWMRLAMRMPLLGYGARMLETIRTAFYGADFVIAYPHSLYFWILLTAGIPGLVAFLILIGALLVALVRVYRANVGPSRAWSAVFVAVLAAWLANEYKMDCVRSPLYFDWLMFVLGMPLALFAARSSRGAVGSGDAHE
jgi:O-antigen ligase